jgi:hypothetical protein
MLRDEYAPKLVLDFIAPSHTDNVHLLLIGIKDKGRT